LSKVKNKNNKEWTVLDGVDVRVVATKGLDALASSDVPNLGGSVAGTRDEDVLVGVKRQANQTDPPQKRYFLKKKIAQTMGGIPHDIASVVSELGGLHASLDIPEQASHVTGRGEDLTVAKEAAAREVASVCRELACYSHGTFNIERKNDLRHSSVFSVASYLLLS